MPTTQAFFQDAAHFAEEFEPVTLEAFNRIRHAVQLKNDPAHFFEFTSIERLLLYGAISCTHATNPLTRERFTIHDVEAILTPSVAYRDFQDTVSLLALLGKRELPPTIEADLDAYFRSQTSAPTLSIEQRVQRLKDRIDAVHQLSAEQDPAFQMVMRHPSYTQHQRRVALIALQFARLLRIGCGMQSRPEEIRFHREKQAVEYFEARLANVWPAALPMPDYVAAAYQLARGAYQACPNRSLRHVLRWTDRLVSARTLACAFRPNQRFERGRMARELGRVLEDCVRRKGIALEGDVALACADPASLLDARLPRITDGKTWWYVVNAPSPADQILSALGRIPEAAVQAMHSTPWPLRHLVELALAAFRQPCLVYPWEAYERVLRTDGRLYQYVLPAAPPPPDQAWHEPLFLLAQREERLFLLPPPQEYDDESMDAAELPQIRRCPSISKAPFYLAMISATVVRQS